MSDAPSYENLPSAQILAGSASAAAATATTLQSAAIPWQIHKSLDDLLRSCEETPGVLLFVEKSLDSNSVKKLSRKLAFQPQWSDVPIIVATPEIGLGKADENEMLSSCLI